MAATSLDTRRGPGDQTRAHVQNANHDAPAALDGTPEVPLTPSTRRTAGAILRHTNAGYSHQLSFELREISERAIAVERPDAPLWDHDAAIAAKDRWLPKARAVLAS